MKRICSIILALCIAFSIAACHSKAPDPTIPPTIPTADPTEPTAVPTDPTEPEPIVFRQEAPFSKENVSDFYALFSKIFPSSTCTYYEECYCYNDTPPEVFEETGIQFFNFEDTSQSFLMFDGKIYTINGSLMWITSMTNAIPYDYDGDGVKDLIFSYWTDIGSCCTNTIEVFNPVSKEFTRLFYKGADYDSVFYITASKDDSQPPFIVWSVHFELKRKTEVLDADNYLYHYTLLWKEHTVTGIAGHLKTVDGRLQFVPYTE